jgi:hypothetical protein
VQGRVRIRKNDTLSQRVAYGRGALLLSIPFVLVGATFAVLGFADVRLKGANAPMWVIGATGLSFLLAGVLLLANAVRGIRAASRRRALADAPAWERDFPWDRSGTTDRTPGRVANAFLGSALLLVFLVPFNWWAFLSGKGPLPVEVFVAFFDLLLLAVLGNAGYLLLQLVKYGRSRLGFRRFPFLTGERLSVVFSPNRFAEVRFVLRCVEERFETTGAGKNRTTSLVCDQIYRDERVLEPGSLLAEVEVEFDLPDEPEWGNRFGEMPLRYWELLVEAEEPGVDFSTSFLLPVYYTGTVPGTHPVVSAGAAELSPGRCLAPYR